MNKVQQDLNQILLDDRKAKDQTPWEGSGGEAPRLEVEACGRSRGERSPSLGVKASPVTAIAGLGRWGPGCLQILPAAFFEIVTRPFGSPDTTFYFLLFPLLFTL